MIDDPMFRVFMKALEEDPLDIVTRKAFADWLEEKGHDDYALVQREWTKEKYDDALEYFETLTGIPVPKDEATRPHDTPFYCSC